VRCSFPAKGYFRAVHAINARFAARRATGWNDDVSRQEAKFHEAAGDVFRQIEPIEDASYSFGELRERSRKYTIWHSA
jgi:hypothetical protein